MTDGCADATNVLEMECVSAVCSWWIW